VKTERRVEASFGEARAERWRLTKWETPETLKCELFIGGSHKQKIYTALVMTQDPNRVSFK